jgi:hypothetical protein
MKDGGLRSLFRKELKSWQWSTIEVGATAGGIPDSEFCTYFGIQGWIEFKFTKIYYVSIKPLQVAWLMRRCRLGGNAFIAVRRTPTAAIHNGADELWLMRGHQAEALCKEGLEGVHAICWHGGPSNWNFDEVSLFLQGLKKL